jgi:hypothetical protein
MCEDSAEGDQSFRREADHDSGGKPIRLSERSDAGTSMLPKLIGIVEQNLSGAKRRENTPSRERGAGKGAAALVPASAHSDPEARIALRPETGYQISDFPVAKSVPPERRKVYAVTRGQRSGTGLKHRPW